FSLEDQPRATQQGIRNNQTQTGKNGKWMDPVQRSTGIRAVDDGQTVDIGTQHHALKERRAKRAKNKGLVPPMPFIGTCLESKLESNSAKNQPQQHEDQGQHEGMKDDGIRQRKRRKQPRS